MHGITPDTSVSSAVILIKDSQHTLWHLAFFTSQHISYISFLLTLGCNIYSYYTCAFIIILQSIYF